MTSQQGRCKVVATQQDAEQSSVSSGSIAVGGGKEVCCEESVALVATTVTQEWEKLPHL